MHCKTIGVLFHQGHALLAARFRLQHFTLTPRAVRLRDGSQQRLSQLPAANEIRVPP